MSRQSAGQGTFSFFVEKPVVVEQGSTQLTSDAGLLVFREFDDKIGWTERIAAALDDPRADAEHSMLDMVRMGCTASSPTTRTRTTIRRSARIPPSR